MLEREYRIRKLSDGSGYIVLVLKGLHDVETLPKVYAKQKEAREAIKEFMDTDASTTAVIVTLYRMLTGCYPSSYHQGKCRE